MKKSVLFLVLFSACQPLTQKNTPSVFSGILVGGSAFEDYYDPSITTDKDGNVYICGFTKSPDFQSFEHSYQKQLNNNSIDLYIAKYNNELTQLLAFTYLGGSKQEIGSSICTDKEGFVYVAGYTESDDFPVTSETYSQKHRGKYDIYITKLNSDLSTVIASTYYGGSEDEGNTWPKLELKLNDTGDVYVAGLSMSADLPVTENAFDKSYNGGTEGGDFFIARFSNDLSMLKSATFIGGNGTEWRPSITIDNNGAVFLSGDTFTNDYPTTKNAHDTSINGHFDVVISKFSPDLSSLTASTFFGGSGEDEPIRMEINDEGDVYIAGYTASADFPVTDKAFDTKFEGGKEAFVAVFDNSLSKLKASTFLGGENTESCMGIVIKTDGSICVTGKTNSGNFPLTPDAYESAFQGDSLSMDAFVSQLDKNLSTLMYSTYIGGSSNENGIDLVRDNNKHLFVVGWTMSKDFPFIKTTDKEKTLQGQLDNFILKIK